MRSWESAGGQLIARHREPGLDMVRIGRRGCQEYHLLLTPSDGESCGDVAGRIAAVLGGYDLEPLRIDVFGPAAGGCPTALVDPTRWPRCPVVWVEDSARPAAVSQVQIHAVAGLRVETVEIDGRAVGRWFEQDGIRTGVFGDLHPADTTAPRPKQARQALERLETALGLAGFAFTEIARTWLHIDDILGWYRELNQVRNAFFTERGLFERILPASTGIGMRNDRGSALTVGALAVQGPDTPGLVSEVESPRQNAPREYGSAFSRAVELALPEHRRLLVSGTASIDERGQSVRDGDIVGQIEHTMSVVAALLASRQMGWDDVVRADAYVRDAADLPAVERWLAAQGLEALPVRTVGGVICRPELLYEIEVDAVTAR